MRLQDKEPDRHGVKWLSQYRIISTEQFSEFYYIIIALAHLSSVDGDHVIMHPVFNRCGVVANSALGNFTFVMRELEIHSTTMNIELLSQIFCSHCRTLDMPARKAFTPGTFPSHDVFRRCIFPKRKI